MPFVLERLTDDQREQAGFARTLDDLKVGMGMKFVDGWSIDRGQDTFLVFVDGRSIAEFELHWKNMVSRVTIKKLGYNEEDPENVRYKMMVVKWELPQSLKPELNTVKQLMIEALEAYGSGDERERYYRKGEVTVASDPEIRFPQTIKSVVMAANYETAQ